MLDTSGTNHHFGNCAETLAAENACSLNLDPAKDAEDPRVAAGTLTPGGLTVPWVVWTEKMANGKDGIFVSRLVNGDHFELFNGGQPISDPNFDSDRGRHHVRGQRALHHVAGDARHDQPRVQRPLRGPDVHHRHAGRSARRGRRRDARPGLLGLHGQPVHRRRRGCPGGAAGTPFFLRTTDDAPKALLAHAYAADSATTGAASSITENTATVAGSANTGGGPVNAHVEFGTTTAYGSVDARTSASTRWSRAGRSRAALDGLPAGTTIHYRVVVSTDFGTLTGDDATFTTAAPRRRLHRRPRRYVIGHKAGGTGKPTRQASSTGRRSARPAAHRPPPHVRSS